MRSSNHPTHTNQPLNSFIDWNQSSPLEGIDILLVEDELDIAELLIVVLKCAGAKVVWAALANEALNLLEHFEPDVLICNIRLPDRDGDWLIQQIRAKEAGGAEHLPAIAVTSYSRDITAEPMLSAGFDCFLSKLQDPSEFISTIAHLL